MATRVDLSVGAPAPTEVEAESGDHGPELDELEPVADVDPSVVRGLLSALGRGANGLLKDEDVPDAWRFTPGELDDLAPPLTRIINRRPALKRAVIRGDEATVAVLLAGYAGRNVTAIRDAREKRNGDEPRQAGPAAGPRGTGNTGPGGGPAAGGQDGAGVRNAPSGGLA